MILVKKQLILSSVMLFLFLNFGCSTGEDSDVAPCSVQWSIELQDEIDALSQAAIIRGQNPSPATCENFRSAAEDYLEALRPYGNCSALTGQNRQEWQNAVEEAEVQIQEIDCSQDT